MFYQNSLAKNEDDIKYMLQCFIENQGSRLKNMQEDFFLLNANILPDILSSVFVIFGLKSEN